MKIKFPKKERNQLKRWTIFSKRDQIEIRNEKELNKKQKRYPLYINLIFFAIILIFLIFFYYSISNVSEDSMRETIKSFLSIIGIFLTLFFTICFFYIQSSSRKYLFTDFNFFLKDKRLMSTFIIIFITIILDICWVLYSLSDKIFFSLLAFLNMLTLISPIILIKIINNILRLNYFIKNIYFEIWENIQNKERAKIESNLQKMDFLLVNSIELRDRDLFKLVVELLHDLGKDYIKMDRDYQFKHLESISDQKDSINSGGEWFISSILQSFTTAYTKLLEANLINLSNYLIRATNSLGIESLNYYNNSSIDNRIIDTYKDFIKKDLLAKNLKNYELRFNHYFTQFNSIENSWGLFSSLFDSSFVAEILKKNPSSLVYLIDIFLNQFQHFGSIEKIQLNSAYYLSLSCLDILYLSRKLEDIKEFSGQILYENKKLQTFLEKKSVILSLILLYYGNSKNSKLLKRRILQDKIDINKLIKQIKKNVKSGDIDGYYIQQCFGEYEGNEKKFNKDKFNKTILEYKKL